MHPQSAGLVGMWAFGSRFGTRNIVTGVQPTLSGSPGFGSSLLGPALITSAASCVNTGEILNSGWASFTFAATVIVTDNSNYPALIGAQGGSHTIYFYTGAGANLALDSAGQVNVVDSGNGRVSLNAQHHLAVSYTIATGVYALYIDGVRVSSGTNIVNSGSWGTGQTVFLGNLSVGGGQGMAGTYIEGKVYNNILSDAQIAWLAAEPFAMVRPVVRRQYYVGAASGGSTYSGSLTDSIATSDALTSVLVAHGTLSDTTATSDAMAGALAALASLSDTAATSDTLTASVTVHATLSDTLATSDTLTGAISIAASLSDTAATSESLTSVLSATGVLADTAATSDAVLIFGGAAYSGTLADTAATSDSLTGAVRVTASLSDTTATSDAVIATVSLSGALADSVATSDAMTSTGQFHGALADTVATSDLLLRFGANAYTASLADAVGTSDAFFSRMAAHASWADTTATAGTFRAAAAPLGPATTIIPGPLIRPPLNDPPMRGTQFSQAWSGFFQNIAGQVAATAAVTTSAANLATAPSYANDAAAAAGGVAIGSFYRNGSVVCVRLT